MKPGGGGALNFNSMIEDEHNNCRNQEQNENTPDIGKKPDPPRRPDFMSLLNPGPVGHSKIIGLHAWTAAFSVPLHHTTETIGKRFVVSGVV